MGNNISSPNVVVESPLYDRQTFPRTEKEKKLVPQVNTIGRNDTRSHANGNQENSRMLFLMYLINRTWNVVVDGKGKRWVYILSFDQWFSERKLHPIPKTKWNWKRGSIENVKDFQSAIWCFRFHFHHDLHYPSTAILHSSFFFDKLFSFTSGLILNFLFVIIFYSNDEITHGRYLETKGNDDNYSCVYGSECSYCSCGYCEDETCRVNGDYSICERWVLVIIWGMNIIIGLLEAILLRDHCEKKMSAFIFLLI